MLGLDLLRVDCHLIETMYLVKKQKLLNFSNYTLATYNIPKDQRMETWLKNHQR